MNNFHKKKLYKSKNIKLKHFIPFCSNADNERVVHDEFKAIEERAIFSKTHDFKKYEDKNRYKDILPYRHNRVMLTPNKYCEVDYINASHIKGYKQKKHYIATQHPLSTTVYDFWHMIIQNNCHTIVMLTQMCTQTCYKYYPDWNVQLQFNDISVYNIIQTDSKAFRRRILLVTKSDETRIIKHYHLLTWSNPNTPAKTADLLEFIRCIRNEYDKTHPILVLSSSGVGRTGIYIALDILIDQAQHKKYVNIFKTVAKLCKERIRMICSFEQYQMIYETLDMYVLHTVDRK